MTCPVRVPTLFHFQPPIWTKREKVFRAGLWKPNILLWLQLGKKFIRSQKQQLCKRISRDIGGKPYGSWYNSFAFFYTSMFSDLINHDKAAAVLAVRCHTYGSTKTNEPKIKPDSGGYLNGEAALALMDTPCDGKLLLPSPKGELAICH